MFRFTAQTIPNNIFVIGAGGTGSRLIPLLAQFMKSITRGESPRGWVERPKIILIDDDTVEQKNLLRQNFIASDIGKHKATVLAERYSRAYEIPIISITERVENSTVQITVLKETLKSELLSQNQNIDLVSNTSSVYRNNLYTECINNSMVIMCVDSSKARRNILNFFGREGNIKFFIDAGNEDSFGQVSFFTQDLLHTKDSYSRDIRELPKLITAVVDINIIPVDIDYYLNLEDTESTASCADLNQTLAINAQMATEIIGIVQNFYYRKPMMYDCVRKSLDGGSFTEYLSINRMHRRSVSSKVALDIYDGGRNGGYNNGVTTSFCFAKTCVSNSINDLCISPLKGLLEKEIKEIAAAKKKEKLEKKALEEKLAKEYQESILNKVETEKITPTLEISVSHDTPEVSPISPHAPLTPMAKAPRIKKVLANIKEVLDIVSSLENTTNIFEDTTNIYEDIDDHMDALEDIEGG